MVYNIEEDKGNNPTRKGDTTMMTANEARKITDEVNTERANQHKRALEIFLKESAEPEVRKASQNGENHCKFTGSCLFSAEEVTERLKELGFSVETSETGAYGLFILRW